MISTLHIGPRSRTVGILGLACPLLGLLACGGHGVPAIIAPPSAPAISVPATATVGFQTTATIQNPSTLLAYRWTIAPGTFKGGATAVNGTSVLFTPTAAGTVTLTCVATKGNTLSSPAGVATVTVAQPSTAAGSFQAAGSLLQGRQGLAAVALPSGSILVMGGLAVAGGPGQNSTEIYNPATQTSAAATFMNTARAGHAAAPLPGSATQFLITGGTGSSGTAPTPASEIYDSNANTFTPAGAMVTGRTGHTATAIVSPPGVLVAGGLTAGGALANTAELFDPSSHGFTTSTSVALAPGHTATDLGNGKVLFVSHTTASGVWQPFATVYDTKSGTFAPTAGQPGVAREGHVALRLTNPPKVLILGGDGGSGPVASAEWYDPATGLFTPVANPMGSPRRDFAAAVLPASGKVLLLGGTADGSTATATAEVFDPVAGTFTPTGSMGAARRGPTAFTLASGKILVLGGSNEVQGPVAAVEAF